FWAARSAPRPLWPDALRDATGGGFAKRQVRVIMDMRFRTFTTTGLEIPTHLRELIATVGSTHDSATLAPVAAQVPDAFVDAVTFAGTDRFPSLWSPLTGLRYPRQ